MSRKAGLLSRRFLLQFLSATTALQVLPPVAPAALAGVDDPAPPAAVAGSIRGAQVATAAELKAMVDRGDRVVIIDARRMGKWESGHIANALKAGWRPNFVMHGWSFDGKLLGSDKAAPIVIYGENATDGWAGQVVEKAIAEGFTNVMWLRGGFTEWVAAGLPTNSRPA